MPGDEIGSGGASILGALAKSRCRREVVFFGVLTDDAVGRKCRSQARHAFAHTGNPAAWNSMLIPRIEFRGNFSFEQGIKTFSFRCIPRRIIAMFAPIPDSPTYFGRIRLRPPAIEF